MRRRRGGPADQGPELPSNGRRRRRGGAQPDEPRRRRRRGPLQRDQVGPAEQVDEQPTPGTQQSAARHAGERRPGDGRGREHQDPQNQEPQDEESQNQPQNEGPQNQPQDEDRPDQDPHHAPPQPEQPATPTRSSTVATEVTLPELGESVTEGTIIAWLVEVGERVEVDQPLFELSSDKIDTEVPSPAAGVLKEIRVGVDETVDVGTVVAVIGEPDEEAAQAPAQPAQPPAQPAQPPAAEQPEPREEQPQPREEQPQPEAHERAGGTYERTEEQAPQPATVGDGAGDGAGQLMSPLVRRMVSEHGLDPGQISGTGEGGRITREDVESAIAAHGRAPEAPEAPQEPRLREREAEQREQERRVAERARTQPQRAPQPERTVSLRAGARERLEDLSRIRQRIAAKMMESMQSSAQLTTVQEADVTRVMRLREQCKDEFKAREGVSLSPFVFLARAAVLAIRRHPMANAQADWDTGKVKFHDYVNLGVAVDTEKGLIVPNVKNADDLTLPALARAINEAAGKARGQGKLEMQDIEGGTFTVTNTGSRGVLIDTPILNYPEVAILATGVIQKRPVVLEDEGAPAIGIRDMVYLCLTYDHRLLDGADAARYVTDVKQVLEGHDWAAELGL